PPPHPPPPPAPPPPPPPPPPHSPRPHSPHFPRPHSPHFPRPLPIPRRTLSALATPPLPLGPLPISPTPSLFLRHSQFPRPLLAFPGRRPGGKHPGDGVRHRPSGRVFTWRIGCAGHTAEFVRGEIRGGATGPTLRPEQAAEAFFYSLWSVANNAAVAARRRRCSTGSGTGTAATRRCVYSSVGLRRISSRVPCSTTAPLRSTAIRFAS
ncbi:hypothetical protein DFR76_105579, partial [Nocardia pseudobrasiliensis]